MNNIHLKKGYSHCALIAMWFLVSVSVLVKYPCSNRPRYNIRFMPIFGICLIWILKSEDPHRCQQICLQLSVSLGWTNINVNDLFQHVSEVPRDCSALAIEKMSICIRKQCSLPEVILCISSWSDSISGLTLYKVNI